MKALVTGASGFIGSTLIAELSARGFQVHALMRRSSSAANLKGFSYTRVEGDLSDPASLQSALTDMDYVFHLAGVIAAPDSQAYFKANAEGTRCLVQAAALSAPGLRRFVHVSSLAAGGPSRSIQPRTESEADGPVSAYGESKLQSEKEVLRFRERFPITIVRPPMVYGPKDKATFVFIQTVSRGVIPIFRGRGEDGHKYYSAIHVKDLCEGLIQAALGEGIPSGEIFYLSGDEIFSYEELMGTIAKRLDKNPWRVRVPYLALTAGAYGLSVLGKMTNRTFPLNVDKLNEIRPDYWICSNEKARKVLGFKPEFDFKRGMADAIRWYQQERWI